MGMTKEAKELKNRYQREWRRKNSEKVKEYQERHWEKKVKELQQQKTT